MRLAINGTHYDVVRERAAIDETSPTMERNRVGSPRPRVNLASNASSGVWLIFALARAFAVAMGVISG
jgi:hypothetical protein